MIELTDSKNESILINFNHVVSMKRQRDHKNNVIIGGGTVLILAYNLGNILVQECLTDIKEELKK
jgi:hypothetical protein